MKAFTLPTIFTAIDKFTGPVQKMNNTLNKFSKSAMNTARTAGIVGAALIAPLALAAHDAIKFEDKMADIAKTTGLKGKELTQFGDDILKMSGDTRTSIEDLQIIGEIGGQLGIAKSDLLGFTDAANKFNVALGKDFSGGVEQAIAGVGKIKNLFKDTRNLNIAESIMKTGSAINELGAAGAATSENIVEFTLRLGALPDAIKPSLNDTLALATYFEEMGLDARIASGGMATLLKSAAGKLPQFAKQMALTETAATALFNSDPTEFAKKLSQSFKGLKGSDMQKTLAKLGVNDLEALKVLGALGANTKRVTELQALSNREFEKGASLAIEYGVKNETMAAKIARAQNNFKALSITIGTELIPIISDLLKEVMPIIRSFTDWVRENKSMVSTFAKVVLTISAFSFAISGAAIVINSIIKVYQAWISVQWALNVAMDANPIGMAILALAALIALVIAVVYHWDKWGAAMSLLLGPFGFLVSLVMSFRDNWQMVMDAFKNDGILSGLVAIGKVLLDVILKPLEQIMSIIADITGFDWAKDSASGLKSFRSDLGLGIESTDAPTRNLVTPLSAAEEDQQSRGQAMNGVVNQNQNSTLTIKNETKNRIDTQSDNNLINIKMGSTMKFGY